MHVLITSFVLCVYATSLTLIAEVYGQDITPCTKYQWRCHDGSCLSFDQQCDGMPDCPDGSDETLPVCRESQCVPSCNRPAPPPATTTGGCVLPPYPEHGTYTVTNEPNARPGQAFDSLQLNVSCHRGYAVIGSSSVVCFQGIMASGVPKCERVCKLDPHESVTYNCLVSGSVRGRRRCGLYEPEGTIVRSECNAPNYYTQYPLPFMRCKNGAWDKIVTCKPDCGKVTPDGDILVTGGHRAKKGELPWHAGIYRKTSTPYMQICGGSLVTTSVLISAAHCFWSDVNKQLPASNYAVAVGKLYRPWDDPNDVDAQKSDLLGVKQLVGCRELSVRSTATNCNRAVASDSNMQSVYGGAKSQAGASVSYIYMPEWFQGADTNYQSDIAILVVATPFQYKTYVRPVCLNFDINFGRWQLQVGQLGKVAGWGLTGENGPASPVLKVTELPYVDIQYCYAASPAPFKEYISGDKICAGYVNNGTALCKGDSGGGLVFANVEQGKERYYLQGIVSTASRNENQCNANTVTTFTHVIMHQDFILTYL